MPIELPAGFEAFRLHRSDNPGTSVEAAQKAAKASPKAVEAVARAMADGQARIDEEIREACLRQGYVASLATIQHGRLALSEAGLLVEAGTGTTSNNARSRLWVAAWMQRRAA